MLKIVTGKVRQPRRVLLYGTAGVGKTTLAAACDSVVFVPVEDGLSDVGAARFPLCKTFDSVLECMRALYTEEHEYRTVVLDSADWTERLVFAAVASEKGVSSIEDVPYAKGYVLALRYWERLLAAFDALRTKRGMAVVMVAHSAITRFENPETDSYDRFTPRLNKHGMSLLSEWCDEMLFLTYRVRTRATGEGLNRKVKGLGTGERVLYSSERPSHLAKSRCGLPDELSADAETFAAIVRGEFESSSNEGAV